LLKVTLVYLINIVEELLHDLIIKPNLDPVSILCNLLPKALPLNNSISPVFPILVN